MHKKSLSVTLLTTQYVSQYRISVSQFEPQHDKPQADLSLRWAYSHFVGFVMLWLICHDTFLAGNTQP